MAEGSIKPVNLALQGGGAHGAFGWGVLDRLLEDERLEIEGVSAASAGAMNAVVMAEGLAEGGRDKARDQLRQFWHRISVAWEMSPAHPNPIERFFAGWGGQSVSQAVFDMMTHVVSPYQFNPLNVNPLKAILEQIVDFDRLAADPRIKLHLAATNVRTGKIRVFRDGEITADATMASACLPVLFQAVEIEGEHYWDGGFLGNPPIFPLIYNCTARDVVIVHVNPLYRPEIPQDAASVMNRINEISFNSALMQEMRTIAFVADMIDKGQLQHRPMKRMLMHAIEADAVMRTLSASSKFDPTWDFLTHLRDVGRETADAWIAANFDLIGRESSVDIGARYL